MNTPVAIGRALPLVSREARPQQRDVSDITEFRKARWHQILGDSDRLTARLERDGFTEADLASLLSSRAPTPASPPTWALFAAEASARARDFRAFESPRSVGDESPLPFEHLVAPFASVALERLRGRAQRFHSLDPFVRALLRRLTFASARAAMELFSVHPQTATTTDDARYRDFITTTHVDGFAQFFDAYPVLARILATITSDMTDAFLELCDRLDADAAALSTTFGAHGSVAHFDPMLGDSHDHGRSVVGLDFASGVRVAYKPRSVGLDAAIIPLLEAMERDSIPVPHVPRALDRGTHGWVEWVAHTPAQSLSEVETFYARVGSTLAIFSALGTIDAHHENSIATGDAPALIDLETLLGPELVGPSATHTGSLAQTHRLLCDSMVNSGFLSSFATLDAPINHRGGHDGATRNAKRLRFTHTNTDAMQFSEVDAEIPHFPNRPVFAGQSVSWLEFEHAVIHGFRAAYDWLLERKATLLDSGPLIGLKGQWVRVVLRDTSVYGDLASAALDPDLLAFGVDRGLVFERLARSLLDRVELWPVLRLEQLALERSDVPRFFVRAEGTTLVSPDGCAEGAVHTNGIERVRRRLAEFSSGDRERQVGLIRTTRAANLASVARRAGDSMFDEREVPIPGAGSSDLLEAAQHLAGRFSREAIRGQDGSANWIGISYNHRDGAYALRPMGMTLGDGTVGVAVFLAAVARVGGDAHFGDLARAAVAEALDGATKRRSPGRLDLIRDLGHGGVDGLGSVIYGLVTVSRLLRDRTLLDAAESLARRVTTEMIASDVVLDVMAGSAGTLLGLVSLHRETGSEYARERAIDIGRLLLKRQQKTAVGAGWKTLWNTPITGFSHGASGIAFALMKLCQLDIGHELRDALRIAAHDAFDFERSTMDRTSESWPDLRPNADGATPVAWCHGAGGIGLARLSLASSSRNTSADLERALRLVLDFRTLDSDVLCCGVAGRSELLMSAAAATGRPELHDAAKSRLRAAVARSNHEGSFRLLLGRPTDALIPGLFQGAAGIGYQLLRAHAPSEIPSILTFS